MSFESIDAKLRRKGLWSLTCIDKTNPCFVELTIEVTKPEPAVLERAGERRPRYEKLTAAGCVKVPLSSLPYDAACVRRPVHKHRHQYTALV
eukprot:scaffold19116_cov76-Phaeocystis_antarctica.AAC.2